MKKEHEFTDKKQDDAPVEETSAALEDSIKCGREEECSAELLK